MQREEWRRTWETCRMAAEPGHGRLEDENSVARNEAREKSNRKGCTVTDEEVKLLAPGMYLVRYRDDPRTLEAVIGVRDDGVRWMVRADEIRRTEWTEYRSEEAWEKVDVVQRVEASWKYTAWPSAGDVVRLKGQKGTRFTVGTGCQTAPDLWWWDEGGLQRAKGVPVDCVEQAGSERVEKARTWENWTQENLLKTAIGIGFAAWLLVQWLAWLVGR